MEYQDKHVSINPITWVTNYNGIYMAAPGSKLLWSLAENPDGTYSISLNGNFPDLGNGMEFVQMFQDGVDDYFTRRQIWEAAEAKLDQQLEDVAEDEGLILVDSPSELPEAETE